MYPRFGIRNTITPCCVFIEDKLLSETLAQRFRRLQHRIFGLTGDEWNSLSAYFTSYEELGVAVQRESWLRGESVRLKCILLDEMSRGESRPDLVYAYADILHERMKNRQACRHALDKWKATAEGIKDTPICRGLCSTRSKPYWWLSGWFRKQCAKSGGCCGRDCQCCRRFPDLDFETWGGHCTPACPCCLDHIGIDKPIEQLKSHGERRFDPRPGQRDLFTRKMLKAYAWHH